MLTINCKNSINIEEDIVENVSPFNQKVPAFGLTDPPKGVFRLDGVGEKSHFVRFLL
jgi:hypothetical protein